MAAEINSGKQQIAQLGFDGRFAGGVARGSFSFELGGFLGEFWQEIAPARPIES